MRRTFYALGLLLTAATLAAAGGTRILLIARDHEDHPLPGVRFAFEGIESKATNQAGATELDLPTEHQPGQPIKLLLLPSSKRSEEWFLVNSQVNIPNGASSAEVVLMQRSVFRQVAAEARDARRTKAARSGEATVEDRRQALISAAARHGLSAEQVESAVRSFAETQDPKDRGIVAYLEGHYLQAEELLNGVAEKKEQDFVETLRYLGVAQYQQGKYRAAVSSFRKALSLHGESAVLLSWLGNSLRELAEWTEAERLLRQALDIDENSYGPERSEVATDLNNLAELLQATNRPAEAELLMRRALAIAEKNFGPKHPNVADALNDLALLLQATNRSTEAERLMRQALDIDENSYGPEHPSVATDLNNLALLLKLTNRLKEAEPLMRRALAIIEKSLGPEHPNVAMSLNNLAGLLRATNRLTEAEPLIRRALAIFEKSLGPNHPVVATALNGLFQLLLATNRLAEAEPVVRRALAIDEANLGPEDPNVARDLNNLYLLVKHTNPVEAESLIRRALAIDEKSYGPEHPNLARDLNNLALLLKNTNRPTEAEPLMRRALANLLEFRHRTGHEHPNLAAVLKNYTEFLKEMGKSDAEVDATIEMLARSQE
ncbi:MAG: tetratricopeptide repeat protein [Acidobacteria bacterium]|nr:tetratricopeptide repeat protein [Acidobacteriota bacterium]